MVAPIVIGMVLAWAIGFGFGLSLARRSSGVTDWINGYRYRDEHGPAEPGEVIEVELS